MAVLIRAEEAVTAAGVGGRGGAATAELIAEGRGWDSLAPELPTEALLFSKLGMEPDWDNLVPPATEDGPGLGVLVEDNAPVVTAAVDLET